jgi:hypothetical protein
VRLLFLAAVALALGACSTTRDPHAPKTVVAAAEGGSVTMKHGQRLRIPLATPEDTALEWHRVEPPLVAVIPVAVPDAQGFLFTPVRSGNEKLVFEYRPVSGEGSAEKSVAYDVTVR